MNKREIINMLASGENCEIEFKQAKKQIPKSLWSTYSAFANTNGGLIVLGVNENKNTGQYLIEGVENIDNILKDFWNTINNQQKVSVNILNNEDVQVLDIEGLKVIGIRVHKAQRMQKPVYISNTPITGTYKRNYEGDYVCTKKEITDMMAGATDVSNDNMIVEDYTADDLNKETVESYRARYKSVAEDGNLWNDLDDVDFLRVIGAIDKKTNNVTLAGLLVFGNESDIIRILPNYQLDYKELIDIDLDNDQRWSHRIVSWNGMWSGNLYDFYRRIIGRLTMDLEVPFALDKELFRIDTTPVHKAVREALVNCLVHTNYILGGSISVEKGFNYFKFENPGDLRIPFQVAKKGGESDQRNPIIHKIFALVGLGERTGSGINMMVKVWEKKNWKEPILYQVDGVERTQLFLQMITKTKQNPPMKLMENPQMDYDTEVNNPPIESTNEQLINLTKTQLMIIQLVARNNNMKIDEIAKVLGIKPNTVKKNIKKLKEYKLLEREGTTRNGCWKVYFFK